MNDKLVLKAGDNRPSLKGTDLIQQIYKSERCQFMGMDFVFNIIGSSHYIFCEEADFHEILACVEMEENDTREIKLEHGEMSLYYNSGPIFDTTTLVKSVPIERFSKDDMDIKYKFGENAYTGIEIFEDYYHTYHTYPEKDLAIYSITKFSL